MNVILYAKSTCVIFAYTNTTQNILEVKYNPLTHMLQYQKVFSQPEQNIVSVLYFLSPLLVFILTIVSEITAG